MTSITDTNTKEVLKYEKTKPQTTSTVELGQNFLRQENVVEDVQGEERPPSLIAKNTRKKYIKAVNKKLHEDWNQDKRAGSIKNG